MSPHHDGRDSFPQFSARERGDNDLLRPLLQEEEMKPTGVKTSPLSSIHHHRAGKTQSKTRRPNTQRLTCVCVWKKKSLHFLILSSLSRDLQATTQCSRSRSSSSLYFQWARLTSLDEEWSLGIVFRVLNADSFLNQPPSPGNARGNVEYTTLRDILK